MRAAARIVCDGAALSRPDAASQRSISGAFAPQVSMARARDRLPIASRIGDASWRSNSWPCFRLFCSRRKESRSGGRDGCPEAATQIVIGRRTGRLISFPLLIADYQGERYLVAMLGDGTNWVSNVRAAGGQALLCHGRRESVRLRKLTRTTAHQFCGITYRSRREPALTSR